MFKKLLFIVSLSLFISQNSYTSSAAPQDEDSIFSVPKGNGATRKKRKLSDGKIDNNDKGKKILLVLDSLGLRGTTLLPVVEFLQPKKSYVRVLVSSGEELGKFFLNQLRDTASLYDQVNSGLDRPYRVKLYKDQALEEEVHYNRSEEVWRSVLEEIESETIWAKIEKDEDYYNFVDHEFYFGFFSCDFQIFAERYKNDREVLFRAAEKVGSVLIYASEELLRDRELVLAAVRTCGAIICSHFLSSSEEGKIKALEYAIKDREIVLAAIRSDGWNLRLYSASNDLKNDKELVLAAVRKDSNNFQYASASLRDDPDVFLASLESENPIPSLEFASPRLRSDINIVLASIREFPSSLRHASKELKANKIVVTAALKNSTEFPDYMTSKELRQDEDLLALLKENQKKDREKYPWRYF